MTVTTVWRYLGPVLALSTVFLWGLWERSGRLRAKAELAVSESFRQLHVSLETAKTEADRLLKAKLVSIEAARGVVDAFARLEEAAAFQALGEADAEEQAILEELQQTGSVEEASKRSWRRWKAAGGAP